MVNAIFENILFPTRLVSRVLGRREVRVGPVRAVARELHHLRPERSEHDGRLGRANAPVRRRVHRVEIRPHRRDRLAVCRAPLGDRRCMRDPDPEQEAAALLGVDQPKVSAVVRGQVAGVTLDRLMRWAERLDQRVELVVSSVAKRTAAKR